MTAQTSDTLDQLGEALAKAQAEIADAAKSALNPHLRNRYADLTSCWDACRGPLTRHGLSVVQLPEVTDRTVSLSTRLLHASGQWIQSTITIPYSVGKGTNEAQAIGSAITYARRYGLCAMVGIAPGEDDDGSAVGPTGDQRRRSCHDDGWETGGGRSRFCARLGELGLPYDDVAGLAEWLGKPRPSQMTEDQRRRLLAWLQTDAAKERLDAYRERAA